MEEESDSISRIGAVGAGDHTSTQTGSNSAAAAAFAAFAAAAATQKPAKPAAPPDLQAALAQVNEQLADVNKVMELSVDPATRLTIATIRDSQTGEVLQQFPGTNSLRLAEMLASWSPGKSLLLDLIA